MPEATNPQDIPHFPALLTLAETAQAVRASVWTLRRHPEQFPRPIRVGRQLRYRADDVARFLDARCDRLPQAAADQEGGAA